MTELTLERARSLLALGFYTLPTLVREFLPAATAAGAVPEISTLHRTGSPICCGPCSHTRKSPDAAYPEELLSH